MRPLRGCFFALVEEVFFFVFWDKALPTADLEVLDVRPSLSVFDAAEAAFDEVCFLGAFDCDRALPAAGFDFFPVDVYFNVFEAADAAFFRVTFFFAILVLVMCE